ncbi:MAG TPA: ATP-dependent helicase [Williamwhitmania sp.]|nr:ATP-dependent helicase [Williamwhitmania sp.]
MAWSDNIEINSPAYNLAVSDSETIRAVAGPGSGKSFAIKKRILRLLESGVAPDKILAITFTRTAAHDLKVEISSLGIYDAENVHTRTLHSHALKILMRDGVLEQTGRSPRMVIEHEQQPILRDIDRAEFGGVREKKKLLDAYLAAWARLQHDEAGFVQSAIDENFKDDLLAWFSDHQGILVGEVIPIVIDYLRNNPAAEVIGEYDYILVDEFQDLNKSEQEFVKLIRGNSNLVIVGDDDQSIYGFKFAHPQGIQEVDDLFGEYYDVPFDVCRRCPTLVTRMASELISKNPNRTLGVLNPYEQNPEGIVDIVQWPNLDAEMNGLSQFIEDELDKGVLEPSDILILTPRRKIGYRLRDLLLLNEVPVKSYFRESVIDSPEVQRAFSLMNLLANPDDKISLRFLLGFNSPDFRKNQYARLKNLSNERDISIKDVLGQILRGEIPETNLKPIIATYREILADLPNLKNALIENPLDGFYNYFVTNEELEDDFYELDQVYRNIVNEIGTESIEENIDNFNNWFKEVLNKMIETIALPDTPENIDHARIMSLHSSKGLSAKLVILTSMIDSLIPFLPYTLEQNQREPIIQEARRLFYVAITRCKSSDDYDGRLIISSFLSIPGVEALQMGVSANPKNDLRTRTTRFVSDFGRISPRPKRGDELE